VLPVLVDEWVDWAYRLGLLRRHDLVATARASMVHEVPVLSSEPGIYLEHRVPLIDFRHQPG
jgi:hypothetical protein